MALTKPQGDMLVKLGTQTTPSSTATTFTGIPAGTTHIIVSARDISTNGTGRIDLVLGDSGGTENTGYTYAYYLNRDATTGFRLDITGGFSCSDGSQAAAETCSFVAILTLVDPATFTWSCLLNGKYTSGGTEYFVTGYGHKALSAVLDRVGIVTDLVDTFDAGSINIAYF